MSQWIDCKSQLPPKEGKFLYSYFYGVGLGEWGKRYAFVYGKSRPTSDSYILVLWPSEIENGDTPIHLNEQEMIEMEMFWMPIPEGAKKCVKDA